MNGLKIGVLTFHRCINYGSYWQARCLAEGLQAMGNRVTILDHHDPVVNIAEWKCAYQPVLPTPVPASDFPLYRKKIEAFFRCFEQLPRSRRFLLKNPESMGQYDTVVVGSDEVWNLFHPWYKQMPVFFGEGIPARTLIAYAASFGNYPALQGLEEKWAEKLYNFDAISVRDENAQQMVKNAIGADAPLVLDPCLQFAITAEEREIPRQPGKYLAVYGHNFSASYVAAARQYAKKTALPLVSIGYRNDWADEQWITADPHDFSNFIAGAQAVITNFFHGCVFSISNSKPFVCETSYYRNIKVQSLMKTLGGLQHLITPNTPLQQFYNCLSNPPEAVIAERLQQLRQQSSEFLKEALNTQQNKVA